MAEDNVQYEAAPDVEIFLELWSGNTHIDTIEANINISRTVRELKQSLEKPLGIDHTNIQVWKGDVQMQDNHQIMDYEVTADDTLKIKDTTTLTNI